MFDNGLTKDEKETPSPGTPEKHQSLEHQRETPIIGTPKIISQYAGDPVERLRQVLMVNELEPKKIRTVTNPMAFLSGYGVIYYQVEDILIAYFGPPKRSWW